MALAGTPGPPGWPVGAGAFPIRVTGCSPPLPTAFDTRPSLAACWSSLPCAIALAWRFFAISANVLSYFAAWLSRLSHCSLPDRPSDVACSRIVAAAPCSLPLDLTVQVLALDRDGAVRVKLSMHKTTIRHRVRRLVHLVNRALHIALVQRLGGLLR